jgi:hypothetical protein
VDCIACVEVRYNKRRKWEAEISFRPARGSAREAHVHKFRDFERCWPLQASNKHYVCCSNVTKLFSTFFFMLPPSSRDDQ